MFSFFENHTTAILSTEMAKRYYKFILMCLKPYGIAEDNVYEYRNRVFVERMPVIFTDKCNIERDHYFIDGEYRFTIKKKVSFGDDSYKTEHRMVVDERGD